MPASSTPARTCRFSRRSIQAARARGVAAHLFCAGEGAGRAQLQAALGPASTFAGLLTQDELARIYASADLFLFPSEIDEFGSAALEALACGLPVLAARGSGFASSMADCLAVRVLPGDDPEPWAAAIADLAAAPHRRRAMGQAGARLCRGAGAELGRGPRTGSAAGVAGGGASAEIGPAMNAVAGRVLILAPHPDDEIVACGIAASRAIAAGARVFVLHLTTGVPPGAHSLAVAAAGLSGARLAASGGGPRRRAAARGRDRRVSRYGRAAPAVRPRRRRRRYCRGDCPLRGGGDLGSGIRRRASGPRRRERAGGVGRGRGAGLGIRGLQFRRRAGPVQWLCRDRGGEIAISGTAAETEAETRGARLLRLGAPQSAAYRGGPRSLPAAAGARLRRGRRMRDGCSASAFTGCRSAIPGSISIHRPRFTGTLRPGSQPGSRAAPRRSATAQAASPGSPTANSRARLTRPSASALSGDNPATAASATSVAS